VSDFWTYVQCSRSFPTMTFDANVLRAMLRLARQRKAAEVDAVCLRVRGGERDVRQAMRRLRASGLVETRFGDPPRLTLEGLAVAVALLPSRRSGSETDAPAVRASRAA